MATLETNVGRVGGSAHRTKRVGGSVGYDPVLASQLEASAGLAVRVVGTQARWRALTGFGKAYVHQWTQDGGPFGVVTRVLHAVAQCSKAEAFAILAHVHSVLIQATLGMNRTEVYDRFWEITEQLEHDATSSEDRAVASLRRTKDLDGLEAADIRKAGIHQERAALIRYARVLKLDLFGSRP